MINIATSGVTNIYIGTSAATAVYVGNTQVWGGTPAHDYSQDYFTIEMLSAGTITDEAANNSFLYSINDGTWTNNTKDMTLSVSAGDKIRFKSSSTINKSPLVLNEITGQFDVYGNTMSLLYGDNFIGQTSFPGGTQNLKYIFSGNNVAPRLINAENLILPATTLNADCYAYMFFKCNNLLTAPKLPATTLANTCYEGMFQNCASLTTAPELPATTLVSSCYKVMFRYCFNLNYIKCLATDISASTCTQNWVTQVASSGTFVKDATMSSWSTGVNGIPNGWNVISI